MTAATAPARRPPAAFPAHHAAGTASAAKSSDSERVAASPLPNMPIQACSSR